MAISHEHKIGMVALCVVLGYIAKSDLKGYATLMARDNDLERLALANGLGYEIQTTDTSIKINIILRV